MMRKQNSVSEVDEGFLEKVSCAGHVHFPRNPGPIFNGVAQAQSRIYQLIGVVEFTDVSAER